MRELEIFINSEIDRIVQENASTSLRFTALLQRNKIIQIFPTERKCRIKVNQIEIPNILYNFPANQNRLSILLYSGTTTTPQSVQFVELDPNRVYNTPNDIITYLNNELQAHANPVMNALVLSFSDLTKKVSIENQSAQNVRVISSFRYSDDADGLGIPPNTIVDRLGFSADYRGVIIPPSAQLTGNGTIRMLFSQCYYLTLNELANAYEQTIIPSPFVNDRILARVTVGNYGTLSQLSYVSETAFNIPENTEISSLSFSLLDDEFTPVNLINHKITFSLKMVIEE